MPKCLWQCAPSNQTGYIYSCNFENQVDVYQGSKRVSRDVIELLDLDLDWEEAPAKEAGVEFIQAIGSGPADESVEVVES